MLTIKLVWVIEQYRCFIVILTLQNFHVEDTSICFLPLGHCRLTPGHFHDCKIMTAELDLLYLKHRECMSREDLQAWVEIENAVKLVICWYYQYRCIKCFEAGSLSKLIDVLFLSYNRTSCNATVGSCRYLPSELQPLSLLGSLQKLQIALLWPATQRMPRHVGNILNNRLRTIIHSLTGTPVMQHSIMKVRLTTVLFKSAKLRLLYT